MFALTVAISTKLEQLAPAQRSIRNPVSFVELSFHDRLICPVDAAVATRLEGALSELVPDVVAVAVLE